MNHQPFETWLFEENPQNNPALQDHLQTCPTCQQIQQNWQAVRQQIQISEQVAPRPGFTARWQASLELRRLKVRQRQQVLIASLVMTAMLITSLSAFGLWAAFNTPARVVIFITRGLTTLLTLNPQEALNWLNTLPPSIPLIFSLGLISWIILLGLLGFNALHRLTQKGNEPL
jgi:hypothetical protein